MKKLLTLALVLITVTTFSQQRRVLLTGKLTDSLSTVKNANIINIKTDQGTFSSDDGGFRIFARNGDSLRISSIQHLTKYIIINKKILRTKSLNLKLTYGTVVLDTFQLKRNTLLGSLAIDTKSTPTNKKDSLLSRLMDFSEIDMTAVAPEDHIDKMKPALNDVDPTSKFAGVGVSAGIPFKSSKRLWALRKKLARNKAFPYKILSELGEKFFFEQLKIPVDRYFHFLEYCNPLGIEKLHEAGKLLALIKIFQRESKTYLEIIKND